MKYLVRGTEVLGKVFGQGVIIPQGCSVVEVPEALPAPSKYLRHVDGTIVVDPDFNAEAEEARRQIERIEHANPITHRALREFCIHVVTALAPQFPEALDMPGVQRIMAIEAQIKELRKKIP